MDSASIGQKNAWHLGKNVGPSLEPVKIPAKLARNLRIFFEHVIYIMPIDVLHVYDTLSKCALDSLRAL